MDEKEALSPRWNTTTKLLVALVIVAIAGWVLWKFSGLVAPLAMALITAYLFNPLITLLSARLKWSRILAAAPGTPPDETAIVTSPDRWMAIV